MAGIPVNNNLNAFAHTVKAAAALQGKQNTPYAGAAYGKQEEAAGDSFDSIMNRVNGQGRKPADVSENVGKTAQTAEKKQPVTKAQTVSGNRTMASESVKQETGQDDKVSDAKTETTDMDEKASNVEQSGGTDEKQRVEDGNDSVETPAENDVSDGQTEAVTEAGEKLVEDVAGEMGITVEEVEEIMEILGLSAVQLLDPENMKQLLIAIAGDGDQLSIITDGELYGHLQNLLGDISESLTELETTLGLSEGELKELIAGMETAEEPVDTVDLPEELPVQPEEEMTAQEGMKDYAVTVHRDGETVEVKVQVEDAGAHRSVQEEVTEKAPETVKAPEGHEEKNGRELFGQNQSESGASGNFMMQTPAEQPVLNDVTAASPVMERFTTTEDIMNQIMDHMKINLRSDVQEMEMQLHPASLGTVNVQLTSREGVVTAQFTTQNEEVKAAIESQLVTLKEQFEEQGIKVDAVEVTVANYRFGQNFSGQEENAGEESGSGKKSPRRINLNDIDPEELPEDMDDAERITADMMIRNGNTVDYTA